MSTLLLEDYGFHSTGTLRANRGEPKEIKVAGLKGTRKLKKGDIVARDNGQVLVMAWQDKRVVRVITTQFDATAAPVLLRKKSGRGEFEEVMKPVAVIEYNRYMCGVDRIGGGDNPGKRAKLHVTQNKIFWWFLDIFVIILF